MKAKVALAALVLPIVLFSTSNADLTAEATYHGDKARQVLAEWNDGKGRSCMVTTRVINEQTNVEEYTCERCVVEVIAIGNADDGTPFILVRYGPETKKGQPDVPCHGTSSTASGSMYTGSKQSRSETKPSTGPEDIHVVVEQFKTLRDEIHLRVQQHAQLVTFKIVSLGAILAFFFDRILLGGNRRSAAGGLRNEAEYFLWLVPLMAIIFDFLIAGNLRAMYNIGPYIKKYIEPHFREHAPTMSFWEETVASLLPKYFCYTVSDLVAIWSLTLGALLLIVLVRRRRVGFTLTDWVGAILSLTGGVVALVFLIQSIKMERRF